MLTVLIMLSTNKGQFIMSNLNKSSDLKNQQNQEQQSSTQNNTSLNSEQEKNRKQQVNAEDRHVIKTPNEHSEHKK